MKLSYSAIRTYLECPFRYRLTYIERLPTQTRPYMKLANALHYTLERFHQGLPKASGEWRVANGQERKVSPRTRTPEDDSLENLLSHFEALWSRPLGKFDQAQYEEGRAILERYYRFHEGEFPDPVLLEERFRFGIGLYGLSGKLDRVDLVEGGYEIIDYKTPRQIPEEMDTLQLDIYQLGFYALTRQVAEKLSFYYLRQGEKRSVERDGENLQRTRKLLCRTAWNMGSDEKLEPKAGGHCRVCDFTPHCSEKTGEPVPLPRPGRPRQLTLGLG